MGETIQRYMDNQMGRMVPAQAGEWCHYEAAADLIESQAAELATLKQQNAEQAKRIGELEKMRVEIDDQNRVLCENNRKQSVSLGALIADTDEQRKERDTLRSELAELRETVEVVERAGEKFRTGTYGYRLLVWDGQETAAETFRVGTFLEALQSLAASGEG